LHLAGDNGGAMFGHVTSELELRDVTVAHCAAQVMGGGIATDGSLNATDVTFTNTTGESTVLALHDPA
jgi:hypothetical protein